VTVCVCALWNRKGTLARQDGACLAWEGCGRHASDETGEGGTHCSAQGLGCDARGRERERETPAYRPCLNLIAGQPSEAMGAGPARVRVAALEPSTSDAKQTTQEGAVLSKSKNGESRGGIHSALKAIVAAAEKSKSKISKR
jgi:hypothetical protein